MHLRTWLLSALATVAVAQRGFATSSTQSGLMVLSALAKGAVAQFDIGSYAGLRNPARRHYFRGEAGTMRMNGELMSNNTYNNGEYQAFLDSIITCRLNGQDIPGTGWRSVCMRNVISQAIVDAATAVDDDNNYKNPANMRIAYGPNQALRSYILKDAGQGPSCDTNPEGAVTPACKDMFPNGGYGNTNVVDFNLDENATGRRKVKVTCKKACGTAGQSDATLMTQLIHNDLVPLLRRNGAMGAGFNFHRASDGVIYARCRLTLAGEVWYDRVTSCPDVVEGSSERVGQW